MYNCIPCLSECFEGWTALQLAVLNGHTDLVSILLNKKANIDIANRCKIYIPECCFSMFNVPIGALVYIHTGCLIILSCLPREGKTSLDIAREEGFDRIVAMILEIEFKDGGHSLPSPPPTPPSAPLLDAFEDVPFIDSTLPPDASTFDRWKIR